YVLLGAGGVVLLRRRVTTFLVWALVACLGGLAVAGGDPAGWGQAAFGVAGAVLAGWPLRGRAPAPAPRTVALEAVADEGGLMIRTVGDLQLLWRGDDLAPGLRRHWKAGYLWLVLLVRALHSPPGLLSRAQAAEELYPRLHPASQGEGFRGRLSDLRQAFPVLAGLIVVKGELLRLDLDGCRLDLDGLRRLRAACAGRAGILDEELLGEVEATLESSAGGGFLPGWEVLEERASATGGATGELVATLRREVQDLWGDLALALGEACLARRQVARALLPLEAACRTSPERPDLARTLVAAYLETGQTGRAADLRRRYEAGEEE
ncbi:MAG: hypothetical protein ACREPI_03265, partial [Candidatus Dormibacterales bacterium]